MLQKLSVLNVLIFVGLSYGIAQNNIPMVISESVEIIKISPNTYVHISYIDNERWGRVGANGLLVKTSEGVIVVDTPWNNDQAEQLLEWMAENWKEKISAIIVTHSHDDCAGGLQAFHEAGITSFGLEMTQIKMDKENLPSPIETFTDSLILNIGGNNIELYYPGAGHSKDNIVVWIPESKVLFGGCMIKTQEQNNLGSVKDADLYEWLNSLKKLELKYSNADFVIPGHGSVGGLELITHTLNLFSEK